MIKILTWLFFWWIIIPYKIFRSQNKKTKDNKITEGEDHGMQYEADYSGVVDHFFPSGYRYHGFEYADYQEPPKINPIDYTGSPVCPSCGVGLEKLPQRKTKCKNCGGFIFHKAFPFEETKKLINEADDIKLTKIRNEYAKFTSAIGRISQYSRENLYKEAKKLYLDESMNFTSIVELFCEEMGLNFAKKLYFGPANHVLFAEKIYKNDLGIIDNALDEKVHFFTLIDGYFRNARKVAINNDYDNLFSLKRELESPVLPHKNKECGDICVCHYTPIYPTIFTIGKKIDSELLQSEIQFIQALLRKYQAKLE